MWEGFLWIVWWIARAWAIGAAGEGICWSPIQLETLDKGAVGGDSRASSSHPIWIQTCPQPCPNSDWGTFEPCKFSVPFSPLLPSSVASFLFDLLLGMFFFFSIWILCRWKSCCNPICSYTIAYLRYAPSSWSMGWDNQNKTTILCFRELKVILCALQVVWWRDISRHILDWWAPKKKLKSNMLWAGTITTSPLKCDWFWELLHCYEYYTLDFFLFQSELVLCGMFMVDKGIRAFCFICRRISRTGPLMFSQMQWHGRRIIFDNDVGR